MSESAIHFVVFIVVISFFLGLAVFAEPHQSDINTLRIENVMLKAANKECRDQFDALIIAIGK